MGMYDELNKISSGILSKSQAKQQIKEQEAFEKELQNEFLQIMQEQLIFAYEDGLNIFLNETKENIIFKTFNEYLSKYNSNKIWVDRFNCKYRKNLQQFLNQNYFTVAGKAERIAKKQGVNNDYKKQIAIEKWGLQKQIMQQKLNEKSQKEAEKQRIEQLRRQQIRKQQINDILKVISQILVFTMKATAYIVIAPLFVIACFAGGFLGGMIKLK